MQLASAHRINQPALLRSMMSSPPVKVYCAKLARLALRINLREPAARWPMTQRSVRFDAPRSALANDYREGSQLNSFTLKPLIAWAKGHFARIIDF